MRTFTDGWERLASGVSVALLLGSVLLFEQGGFLTWIGLAVAILSMVVTAAMLAKMEKATKRDGGEMLVTDSPAVTAKRPKQDLPLLGLRESFSEITALGSLTGKDLMWKEYGTKGRVVVFYVEPGHRDLLTSLVESGHVSSSVKRIALDLEPPWEELESQSKYDKMPGFGVLARYGRA